MFQRLVCLWFSDFAVLVFWGFVDFEIWCFAIWEFGDFCFGILWLWWCMVGILAVFRVLENFVILCSCGFVIYGVRVLCFSSVDVLLFCIFVLCCLQDM